VIIKILSKSRGTIVSVALPPDEDVKNKAEGGPMLTRGLNFDELELSTITSDDELSTLLKNSSLKRGKVSVELVPSKQIVTKKIPLVKNSVIKTVSFE